MQINPEHIINSIEKTAGIHYADADAADRLAWQVGALTAKIRELSCSTPFRSTTTTTSTCPYSRSMAPCASSARLA